MPTIVIKENQTLFDLSLQLYGSTDYIYKIVQDNPAIPHIHAGNLVGMVITYDEQKIDLTQYFKVNNKTIVTGLPIIDTGRAFDDSFDFSFG